MEKVPVKIEVDDNILSIIPRDEEIKDNSQYIIKIKGLKGISGIYYPDSTHVITTAITPMYCSLKSLIALTDTFNIPESNLLSYIKHASEEADFISGGEADPEDFAVQQFVRCSVALKCLLRACMDKTMNGGGTYTLSDATNSTSFKNLINLLRDALKKWQDAIRGYYNEGRVKPKATRIGLKSSSNSEVGYISVDSILNDVTRTPPQWS